jgi:hypothetical protein
MLNRMMARVNVWLGLLGTAVTLTYLIAYRLEDLRENTVGFEIAFFAAFILYLAAVALILQSETAIITPTTWLIIFTFALLPRLLLLPMKPTLSDDMFRYVWDGRMQNNGLSPYTYPPEAEEVADYRVGDTAVWPHINRKPYITVYPPGAQIAYATIWRLVGDSVVGFKAAFVLAELVGVWLLYHLLRALDRPPPRLLIYLWSPLLIYEVAHAGHVDGLMLSLLILAFWARVKERYWLLGVALGAAVLVKLFPLILLPALLPPLWGGDWQSRLRPFAKTMISFGGIILLGYLPYAFWGDNALGFLPHYFGENFNMGLARIVHEVAELYGRSPSTFANLLTFGGLLVMSLYFVIRPAADGRTALLRCVWLIGWFTLFTQNLFPWYLLWLLPLLTCFLEPGKLFGFSLSPITAWFFFSGLVMLAYTFFIDWRIIPWAQVAEYLPLYALLLAAWFQRVGRIPFTSTHYALRTIFK